MGNMTIQHAIVHSTENASKQRYLQGNRACSTPYANPRKRVTILTARLGITAYIDLMTS